MKSKNKNMLVIPSKKKGEKKVKIVFKNELTIFSIEDFKDQFIDTVINNDEINIDLKDVKNLDLTFVQLIYSLKITANKLKKKVSLNTDLSKDLMSLFNNSGLNKVLK